MLSNKYQQTISKQSNIKGQCSSVTVVLEATLLFSFQPVAAERS